MSGIVVPALQGKLLSGPLQHPTCQLPAPAVQQLLHRSFDSCPFSRRSVHPGRLFHPSLLVLNSRARLTLLSQRPNAYCKHFKLHLGILQLIFHQKPLSAHESTVYCWLIVRPSCCAHGASLWSLNAKLLPLPNGHAPYAGILSCAFPGS